MQYVQTGFLPCTPVIPNESARVSPLPPPYPLRLLGHCLPWREQALPGSRSPSSLGCGLPIWTGVWRRVWSRPSTVENLLGEGCGGCPRSRRNLVVQDACADGAWSCYDAGTCGKITKQNNKHDRKLNNNHDSAQSQSKDHKGFLYHNYTSDWTAFSHPGIVKVRYM